MAEKVTYKGKQYLLHWQGTTKYGRRAKLSFLDGSKEFWVDASLLGGSAGTVQATAQATRTPGGASEKQVAALRKMLRRLELVHQFDSFGGDGRSAADDIRQEISKAGGLSRLTARKASELISSIGSMIDDEM